MHAEDNGIHGHQAPDGGVGPLTADRKMASEAGMLLNELSDPTKKPQAPPQDS
jgi:hypothetical protein